MSNIRYNNAGIEIIGGLAGHSIEGRDKGARGKGHAKPDFKVCADVKTVSPESCTNAPVAIGALGSGVVAKLPVVLAQFTIQAHVNSIIELPEFAFEIKRINKRVKVTQCLLLQDTNVLFIKGFIRKNIEYATRSCSNKEGFCGDIKHCTVDVPFSCTTPITFNGTAPLAPVGNTSTEFEYSARENIDHPDFGVKDHLLSGDLREKNVITTEFFNELPFCDLISARIVEFDEQLQPIHPDDIVTPFEEKKFKRIEEKMVIFLTLRLLQNRQVAISPYSGNIPCEG
jgi:hypothetical protein